MEAFTLPLSLPFMQNAYLAMALVAPAAALLSCFLVLKGWSLIGDAVSHGVLPGVVLAYVLGLPLIVGAFAAGLFTALATGFIRDHVRVKPDTVMGVVFSGMFGLGIVMVTQVQSDVHLDHILFGNILGIGRQDLWVAGGISGVVCLGIALNWRALLAHAFDPVQARMVGLRVGWLHYGLIVAIAATVVAMLSAVGIVLAVALLIAPGAIAFLLARRFGTMLVIAMAVTWAAGFAGITGAFWLDAAPAPTIVLVLTALFVLALVAQGIARRQTTP